ncbi:hypothetical protein DSOL_5126 [Desulfosporosinus metallidurans]|uniref:Recombinase domain-containing protein n=1 Tax=Desulfosporosinus metallidurans TaxID=1888891 RepID=A0A1Q8QFI6_9FIRM|nr:hypothetical protein DSOL_5126 [Desulfosporosinus metallidurans]
MNRTHEHLLGLPTARGVGIWSTSTIDRILFNEKYVGTVLCIQDKISGAVRFGITLAIPKDVMKPKDGRYKRRGKRILLKWVM